MFDKFECDSFDDSKFGMLWLLLFPTADLDSEVLEYLDFFSVLLGLDELGLDFSSLDLLELELLPLLFDLSILI